MDVAGKKLLNYSKYHAKVIIDIIESHNKNYYFMIKNL